MEIRNITTSMTKVSMKSKNNPEITNCIYKTDWNDTDWMGGL